MSSPPSHEPSRVPYQSDRLPNGISHVFSAAEPSAAEVDFRRLLEFVIDTDAPTVDMLSALVEAHIKYAQETGEEAAAAEQWIAMVDAVMHERETGEPFVQGDILRNFLRGPPSA